MRRCETSFTSGERACPTAIPVSTRVAMGRLRLGDDHLGELPADQHPARVVLGDILGHHVGLAPALVLVDHLAPCAHPHPEPDRLDEAEFHPRVQPRVHEVLAVPEVLKQFALRGQPHGIRVIARTLTPFENETFLPGAWNPRREAIRQAVNDWLRKTDDFDAVVDFDRALRDPDHPTRMLPIYDCGDHLHPSDLGYRAMGDAIDLALFD